MSPELQALFFFVIMLAFAGAAIWEAMRGPARLVSVLLIAVGLALWAIVNLWTAVKAA